MSSSRVLKSAALVLALPLAGCMAWRSVCLEPHDRIKKDVRTESKYEITEVRYGTDRPFGNDSIECAVEPLFGTPERLDRIMQYVPSVFEPQGVPVTITVRDWRKESSGQWTWFFPFALTATIVPAFITDEYFGEFEVSVKDVGTRRIRYRGVDSWHMSCLGPLGHIPYPQPEHPSACIWERNRGKISLEPARQGLASAIAGALQEIERSAK